MSWKASRSASGVCATSRSTSPPPSARRARWPPLRSAGVRSATSIRNGICSRANQARIRWSHDRAEVVDVGDERVARSPRRAARRACPSSAATGRGRRGRAAPTRAPGRRASRTGARSSARSLGTLLWTKSAGTPSTRSSRTGASAASEALARREAVHEHERQPRARARAQVEDLAHDDVQERQPVLDLEQRLRRRSCPCSSRARR